MNVSNFYCQAFCPNLVQANNQKFASTEVIHISIVSVVPRMNVQF